MKKFYAACLAVSAMGSGAALAGSPYIGLHAGVASLSSDWTEFFATPSSGDSEDSDFIGGIHGGFMHSFDQIMLGVEGDLSFTDVSEGFDGFEGIGVEADFLGSLRARAGWKMDNIMPYLTAGVAVGDLEYTFFFGGPVDSENDTRVGFVGGGGFEVMFAEGWSGRAEVLYYDFGEASGSFPTFGIGYDVDTSFVVARVGLTYDLMMW